MALQAEVLCTVVQRVATVTLNRPKALNSLNLPMVQSLHKLVQSWSTNKGTSKLAGGIPEQPHCLIIQGAGGKAFCAGGDVKSAVLGCKAGHADEAMEFFQTEYVVDSLLANLPMPSVALIDGIVMGGGVGASIYCSFRVATEKTVLAMPECAIGLFPDVGASFFLGNLPGCLGLYMGITGARLTGVEVKEAGLATHYIASSALHMVSPALTALGPRASDLSVVNSTLCDLETRHPPPSTQSSQPPAVPTAGSSTSSAHAAAAGRQTGGGGKSKLAMRRADIQHHFQHGSVEEIVGSLKRAVAVASAADAGHGDVLGVKASGEFASEALAAMSKGSPLSQKLTLSLLGRMKHASLNSCLDTDWVLVDRMIKDQGDFFEGVRAVLIDKDNAPIWKFKSLEDVPAGAVDAFFVPREGLVPLLGPGKGGPLWGVAAGAALSKM